MSRAIRRSAAFVALLATLALPSFLLAQDPPRPPTTFLGLSLSRYLVSDEVFEEVYGGSGSMFGFTAAQRILGNLNFGLEAVLDIRGYSKAGFSTLSRTETVLKIKPASLGFEGTLTRGIATLWLGSGLDLISYSEESVLQDTSGSTFGFHVAGGLAFQASRSFPLRLKLFLRWTKAGVTTADDIAVELGGPEYGASLIFGFRLF